MHLSFTLFHTFSVHIPQLIPEGEPWPASAEGYQNFSQTTRRPNKQTTRPNQGLVPIQGSVPNQGSVPSQSLSPNQDVRPEIIDRIKEESTTTRRTTPLFIPFIDILDSFEDILDNSDTIPAKPAVKPPSFHPVPGKD